MPAPTVAPTIDLSALPAPAVVVVPDFEQTLVDRLASVTERFQSAGVPYNTSSIKGDAVTILQREDAYRQMLDNQRINDSIKAILPAYAQGSDLDHVAARAGILRLVITPATDNAPAVMEGDAQLRQRYLAAFGRPAAGSIDGYIFSVLSALPTIHDVSVLGPETHGVDGRVVIVLLASNGGAVSTETIDAARAAVNAKSIRPLTDSVIVRAALLRPFSVTATLHVPVGPDANIIKAHAEASLRAYAFSRYRVGFSIPATGLSAALYVPNVTRVVMAAPLVDQNIGSDETAFLSAVSLSMIVDQ